MKNFYVILMSLIILCINMTVRVFPYGIMSYKAVWIAMEVDVAGTAVTWTCPTSSGKRTHRERLLRPPEVTEWCGSETCFTYSPLSRSSHWRSKGHRAICGRNFKLHVVKLRGIACHLQATRSQSNSRLRVSGRWTWWTAGSSQCVLVQDGAWSWTSSTNLLSQRISVGPVIKVK